VADLKKKWTPKRLILELKKDAGIMLHENTGLAAGKNLLLRVRNGVLSAEPVGAWG
jgi:hypothetical protein